MKKLLIIVALVALPACMSARDQARLEIAAAVGALDVERMSHEKALKTWNELTDPWGRPRYHEAVPAGVLGRLKDQVVKTSTWPDDVKKAILENRPLIQMTEWQVVAAIGAPEEIRKEIFAGVEARIFRWRWFYRPSRYGMYRGDRITVLFVNGRARWIRS